ncbi:MAG: hypothetical protein K5905_01335 [Roseibium sp.]|uniref:MHYT domain-containing protein n=1 Tax=Roseibium sp. TaxID=1936156 RepID=UPI0026111ADA|nr:MHYT domain-containing protein [Roseibium sp.]MCV0424092.1 hypothetical protein [Roseibium sp.]
MSILFDASLLMLDVAIFGATVFGYFIVSRFFQAKRRRGFMGGDGIAFVIAGVLFTAFTVSYIEIFSLAFRLPFSAYTDLAIGLGSVTVAIALAYAASKVHLTRKERSRRAVSG